MNSNNMIHMPVVPLAIFLMQCMILINILSFRPYVTGKWSKDSIEWKMVPVNLMIQLIACVSLLSIHELYRYSQLIFVVIIYTILIIQTFRYAREFNLLALKLSKEGNCSLAWRYFTVGFSAIMLLLFIVAVSAFTDQPVVLPEMSGISL